MFVFKTREEKLEEITNEDVEFPTQTHLDNGIITSQTRCGLKRGRYIPSLKWHAVPRKSLICL